MCTPSNTNTHFATNPSMSTIIKSGDRQRCSSTGGVQHDAPLGEIRSRVFKEIVQKNLNE